MSPTVSKLFEVPEPLHDGMRAFQEIRLDWTTDRMATAALALWLLQETGDRALARLYLDALFGRVQ